MSTAWRADLTEVDFLATQTDSAATGNCRADDRQAWGLDPVALDAVPAEDKPVLPEVASQLAK
jgi:hypothetical protein